jgi:hypothetical protein
VARRAPPGCSALITPNAGLGPALEVLAQRSPIPVVLEVLTEGRFLEPVEVAPPTSSRPSLWPTLQSNSRSRTAPRRAARLGGGVRLRTPDGDGSITANRYRVRAAGASTRSHAAACGSCMVGSRGAAALATRNGVTAPMARSTAVQTTPQRELTLARTLGRRCTQNPAWKTKRRESLSGANAKPSDGFVTHQPRSPWRPISLKGCFTAPLGRASV